MLGICLSPVAVAGFLPMIPSTVFVVLRKLVKQGM